MDQYLYRLYAGDGTLLYLGISDDWTRRLRQHWLNKEWADDIGSVTLEMFADRLAVAAAERKAIKSERPIHNIQHNHHDPDPEEPIHALNAGEIILFAGLIVLAGFVVYGLTQAAFEKYRAWKADRDEFHEWQRARRIDDNDLGQHEEHIAAEGTPPTAPASSVALPPTIPTNAMLIALYMHQRHPDCTNPGSRTLPPAQAEPDGSGS